MTGMLSGETIRKFGDKGMERLKFKNEKQRNRQDENWKFNSWGT